MPWLQLAPAAQRVCRSCRKPGSIGVRHVLAVVSTNDHPYASQESAKTPHRVMTEEQAYLPDGVGTRLFHSRHKPLILIIVLGLAEFMFSSFPDLCWIALTPFLIGDVAIPVGGRHPATFPWKHSARYRHGLDECAVSAKDSDGQLQQLHANYRPQRRLLARCDSRPIESPLTLYLAGADAAARG